MGDRGRGIWKEVSFLATGEGWSLVFGPGPGSSGLWTGLWGPCLLHWKTTNIHGCSCHLLALSVILSSYHLSHHSPYTFSDTACPLLPKSSYSSTFCLVARRSCMCTGSTPSWASTVVIKRFYISLPILFCSFKIKLLGLIPYLQENKWFESIKC